MQSSSIFNGIGRIAKGATRANAVQESRVLMLSEKARGDANPILLIDEDDVTAGHAASVGRVDPIATVLLDEPWNFKDRKQNVLSFMVSLHRLSANCRLKVLRNN